MNGAQHYAEAERLLDQSVTEREGCNEWHDHLVARAHVHATLAQIAATIEASGRYRAWNVGDQA